MAHRVGDLQFHHRRARTRRRGPPESRGVTLPELLTVVAIIGLTLLILVPTFRGPSGERALRAGARELAAALNEAQRLAIANRNSYAVVIDCNAMSGTGADADPVTRFWVARFDATFDPANDPTDIPDSNGAAPFDGVFTSLEQIGEAQELPRGVLVVAARIQNGGWGNAAETDDFTDGTNPRFRINAIRTEDANLDGALAAAEDLGVDSFDGGNRTAVSAGEIDPGEDNWDAGPPARGIDPIYRFVRFGPQGNADRAVILLWNRFDDTGAPLPENVSANASPALRLLGLPPGMTIEDPADQRNWFTVSDQSKDAQYYTVEVSPASGKIQIHDYGRGDGTVGPPTDWNLTKDGE